MSTPPKRQEPTWIGCCSISLYVSLRVKITLTQILLQNDILRQAFYNYIFVWSDAYPPPPGLPFLIVIVEGPHVQSLAWTYVVAPFCIRAYELVSRMNPTPYNHGTLHPCSHASHAHACPPHECMPMPIFLSPIDLQLCPHGAIYEFFLNLFFPFLINP